MDIVDILFHVHPDLSAEQRNNVEESLRADKGVVSVHFSPEHPHELTVAYDPKVTHSDALLEHIKKWDKEATMIGL